MTYQNIGTVTITGTISISLSTSPSFVTMYNSSKYHYKFVVDIDNDTLDDYTDAYITINIGGGTNLKSSFFDLSAGSSTSITIYYSMNYISSYSQYVYVYMSDNNDNLIASNSFSTDIRSPPTLGTHSFATDTTSYVIGDTLSSSITVQRTSGITNDISVRGGWILQDVDKTIVSRGFISTFTLTDDTEVSKDYSDYTLVANSYTLGTWTITNSIGVGWKGDLVYYKSDGNWYSVYINTTTYDENVNITVSAKPTPTVKFGTNHTLPITVTKGVSSDFDINIINTYSSDKSGYFKLQFGYPSTKTYTYTYVVCSGDTTFTVGDYTYIVSVTIPTDAPNGDYDVKGELRVDETQPSKCGS